MSKTNALQNGNLHYLTMFQNCGAFKADNLENGYI